MTYIDRSKQSISGPHKSPAISNAKATARVSRQFLIALLAGRTVLQFAQRFILPLPWHQHILQLDPNAPQITQLHTAGADTQ